MITTPQKATKHVARTPLSSPKPSSAKKALSPELIAARAANAERATQFGHDTSDDICWHALPLDAVLKILQTSPDGLSDTEVTSRLGIYGRNSLTPAEKPGLLKRIWIQINNILIYILLAAAVVSGVLVVSDEFRPGF